MNKNKLMQRMSMSEREREISFLINLHILHKLRRMQTHI